MYWYALFVKTGKEEYIQKWLRFYFDENILHAIVPKRRLIERKQGKAYPVLKEMFPGYVLIHTCMDVKVYRDILSIPKVIRVLGTGTIYSRIDEAEMAPILKLTDNGEIINYSKVYIENSKVIIKSGPLKGMEGIINRVDARKSRARILLNFMNTPKMFDVGIEVLER